MPVRYNLLDFFTIVDDPSVQLTKKIRHFFSGISKKRFHLKVIFLIRQEEILIFYQRVIPLF
tara:strand:- start:500 stop:685 length:186 start_codon:yes stop_codon:yes gene_type:complete